MYIPDVSLNLCRDSSCITYAPDRETREIESDPKEPGLRIDDSGRCVVSKPCYVSEIFMPAAEQSKLGPNINVEDLVLAGVRKIRLGSDK